MKKIVVAYHLYAYNELYKLMAVEQFRLIVSSGLYNACDKLYIGVTLPPPFNSTTAKEIENWLKSFWTVSTKLELSTEAKVEIAIYFDNKEETRTLKWVERYADNNPDSYVLYCHTKGITRLNEATEDWRHYMEYFTIEKWKTCVEKLDQGFNTCGVLFEKSTNLGKSFPHYSGGFWWANTSYIKTLDRSYLKLPWRYYREFWIGSNLAGKHYELHNSRLNSKESLAAIQGHYKITYPKVMYEDLKDVKILCFVNHYYNPKPKKGEFIGGSTTQSEERGNIVQHVIDTLKEIPGCEVKICGIKGFSVVDIDHDFTGVHPTLIPYESLNLMRSFVDEYDYFINIEDDILLKQNVLKNVIAFDKESELNELFLPNRIEVKDEEWVFVDLEANPGWVEGIQKVFNNLTLKVANTYHSGVMIVSTKKFKAMTKTLDPNYRETFFGGPMASAFAYFHSPFTLYRNSIKTDFHSVEHLDHWVNKDVSRTYSVDRDKYTVIIPTMWFHLDTLNVMLKKYESCSYVEQVLLINNLGTAKVQETGKVKIIGNGVNMYINPAWNMAIEDHVQTDKIVLANDDIVLKCNLDDLFGKVDEVLKPGIVVGSAFSNFPCFKQRPEKEIKVVKGPETITRGSGQFIFMDKESYHKVPIELPIWHGDMIQFEVNEYYVFSGVPIITETRGTTAKIMTRDDARERIMKEREFYLKYSKNGYKVGENHEEPCLNIVLILKLGGDFKLRDVVLLGRHLRNKAGKTRIKVHCFTDFVKDKSSFDNIIMYPMRHVWNGWWAKMNLFSPDLDYLRPFLYLDLDTAVVKSFEEIIPTGTAFNGFIMLRDFYRERHPASGVMWFPKESAKIKKVWAEWTKGPQSWIRKHRGDQDFISSVVMPDFYWQDLTKGIVSFKPAIKIHRTTLKENEQIVCFHGQPRIFQAAQSVPWVNDYVNEKI